MGSSSPAEVYVSVDVETAGPSPGEYGLLSIGACLVDEPQRGFYVELQPLTANALPEALAVNRLSLSALVEHGISPGEAMARFAAWLQSEIPSDRRPVFVALNAPFDWMFVNDYFHRFLGWNPFGHSALDMKALYMGLTGCRWSESSLANIAARYSVELQLTHHALEDAQDQARLFRHMLDELAGRFPGAH